MSEDTPPVGLYSDNFARVVREWEINGHIGKVLTIIETIGLPEKQEKAIKDLIKTTTWKDLWNGNTPVIYSKEANVLLDKAIDAEYESYRKVTKD